MTKIDLIEGGPIIIYTSEIQVRRDDTELLKNEGTVALCRCGLSSNKPYCDGAHTKIENPDLPAASIETDDWTPPF